MPQFKIKVNDDILGTVDFTWDNQQDWLIKRVKIRLFVQPFGSEIREIIKENPDRVNSVGGVVRKDGAQINYEVLFIALGTWSERRKNTGIESPVPLSDMPRKFLGQPESDRDY